MLAQITAEALLKTSGGTTFTDSSGNATPVLLDGWGNPIIYVPSGGMTGVWMGGPKPEPGSGGISYLSTDAVVKKVMSVDGRPFWASAGPDGDFSQGDDNLYSCPVVYK